MSPSTPLTEFRGCTAALRRPAKSHLFYGVHELGQTKGLPELGRHLRIALRFKILIT
jgi:hypothetical protein